MEIRWNHKFEAFQSKWHASPLRGDWHGLYTVNLVSARRTRRACRDHFSNIFRKFRRMLHFLKIFQLVSPANLFDFVAQILIWIHNISANILYLVGKISDFEMSAFKRYFWKFAARSENTLFVCQVPASPMPIPYYFELAVIRQPGFRREDS